MLRLIYCLERVAAVAAIAVLLVPGFILALAIYLLSRRGPLVRHSRVGQHGTPLHLLKFRTMWDRGEEPSSFFAIEDVSANAVPRSKSTPDARVGSRFAAFCRRYSLDETPQLLHVASGRMSLVGPRPLTAREHRLWYGEWSGAVLSLRPGLTGLWQVSGRNRLSYPQRKRLDLFLARRASARLYFLILLRTLIKLPSGDGAY